MKLVNHKQLYFLLLPLFFVFHEFVQHFFFISVGDAAVQFGIYAASAALLAFFSWLYFKDVRKALLFTFFMMGFNFFFGYIHDGLKFLFPGSFVIKYTVILPIATIIFIFFAVLLKKRKTLSPKIAVFLNTLLLVFILVDVISLIYKIARLSGKEDSSLPLRYTDKNVKPPDVYFIITDEYAGTKDLEEVCNFDNSLFLDSLRNLGFFVARNSTSNYNYTVHSMSSILNMDYVHGSSDPIVKSLPLYPLKLIYENKVTESFRKSGYDIYNFSAFDIKHNPSKNPNLFVPSNTKLFTSQTLINRVKKDALISVAINLGIKPLVKNYAYQNLRYNENVYNQTLALLNTQNVKPKFVYTHLEIPHFPYYYNERGDLLAYDTIKQYQPGDTEGYVEYLKYANGLLLKLVNEIIQKSTNAPIIILMSDHGYRSYPGTQVDYSFVNLFSVFFKDKNYSGFNDSLSGVNVFRALFNTKFGQHLSILSDSTFDVR